MKFTISDQPQPIDALLKTSIGDFLTALTDPDLNVRRVALVAFNSAAHNKPSLIRDLLRKYTWIEYKFAFFCLAQVVVSIFTRSYCKKSTM